MIDLAAAAMDLAAQPVALVGCIVLGVLARTAIHAIAYAAGWALAMQLFVTVTSIGLADPGSLVVQSGLRVVGAAILTLAVYLLYRALRRTGPGSGGRGGGRSARPPAHLRRVK